MQVTKEHREKAAELAAKNKVNTLYVNKKGEFFTSENLASISVNGKNNNYAKIEINEKSPKKETETE